ncbi:MAG TPA: SRPBCC domain-containing protein [Chitinophagaceae bacterium]|nr:SRPBCC domain-containing protein [Chitinophagaceae bacterium]
MTTPDFSTTFSVAQTPDEVFNAITNVRGWWSENIEGGTARLNDVFTYRFSDIHKCTMKLIEVVPGKKVVWLVLDNYFDFTEDKTEWTDTKIEFEIAEKDNKAQLHFTHRGLVPEYECYDICYKGWTHYIGSSLHSLITTGKGQPNPRETVTA